MTEKNLCKAGGCPDPFKVLIRFPVEEKAKGCDLAALVTCDGCGRPLDNVNDDGSIRMRQWCPECEAYDPEAE